MITSVILMDLDWKSIFLASSVEIHDRQVCQSS